MTDKVLSLVTCKRYVRNRDIWDLCWLKRQGAEFNIDWLKNKIQDYKIDNYNKDLTSMQARLPEIISGDAFLNEISRFIPVVAQEQTIKKEKYRIYLTNELQSILGQVKSCL